MKRIKVRIEHKKNIVTLEAFKGKQLKGVLSDAGSMCHIHAAEPEDVESAGLDLPRERRFPIRSIRLF